MNGQEIIDKFYWLVDDDNTDSDQALDLLNTAYDSLMTERIWNFLRKEDSSITLSGSTTSYSLPTDFMYPIKAYRYNSAARSFVELRVVRFEDRMKFHNTSGVVYFDMRQSKVMLSATPSDQGISGETLYLVYQYQPDQLTVATEPTFNRAFHSILAYEMAKFFYYNDQQEKDRSFHREFGAEYKDLKDKMVAWDARIDFGLSPDFVPTDSWVNFGDE